MQVVSDVSIFDRSRIAEDPYWNLAEDRELLLHRIHSYPAKLPPFLVKKLLEFFDKDRCNVKLVADTFCGCGTSALEAARQGKDFWGCDINPVAALIARTKASRFQSDYLEELHKRVDQRFAKLSAKAPAEYCENERLEYWFQTRTIHELYRLLRAIKESVPEGKYRDFFLTGFSNILKPCSRWLTKSIKPQLDPDKKPSTPINAFTNQIRFMIKAYREAESSLRFEPRIRIRRSNLLNLKIEDSFADVVITSPPYVTSYEYADLHQLSAIWLGYASDYRALRRGSIGSQHPPDEFEDAYERANQVVRTTYDKLRRVDNTKARAVLMYFSDLDQSVGKVREILRKGGSAAFIIGDTRYKGVAVNNAKVLAQSLLDHQFVDVRASRRKISYKILTPYRDHLGRFIDHAHGRKVYSHEYVLIASK